MIASARPAPRVGWAIRVAALYCGVFLLLFARRPDALLNAQFWAEDGVIFFHSALLDGVHSLLVPYSGYVHVIPRLVAFAALALPFAFQPLAYDVAALAIAAGVLTLFVSRAYRYLVHSDLARAAIVIAAASVPFGGEVIGDITNIQWFLTLGALLLILYRPARGSAAGGIARGIAAALCAFSAPLTILWLPLALRVIAVPRDRERTTALIVIAGSLVEVGLSLTLLPSTHQPFGVHVLATALAATLTYRVVLPTVLGQVTAIHLTAAPYAAVIITTGLLAAMALLTRNRLGRYRAAMIGLWILASLLITLIGRNFFAIFGSVRHFSTFGGERYFFVGAILIVYLVGSGLAARLRKPPMFAVAMVAVFAFAAVANFSAGPFIDEHWVAEAPRLTAWESAREHHQPVHALAVPINPAGWKIDLPGCESSPAERATAGLACPPGPPPK